MTKPKRQSSNTPVTPPLAIPPVDETIVAPDEAEIEPEAEDVIEELSELDVQKLLEAQDRAAAAPTTPVNAPTPADVVCPMCHGAGHVAASVGASASVVSSGPHALDEAKNNSKIVVTKLGAVMATPDGVKQLPVGDPAHGLPEGARIMKQGPDAYVACQLSAVEDHPEKTFPSAGAAIVGFLAHFHPRGAASLP